MRPSTAGGSCALDPKKPGVVGPRIETNRAYTFKSDAAKAEFPKDLSVQITKRGDEPVKIHVPPGTILSPSEVDFPDAVFG